MVHDGTGSVASEGVQRVVMEPKQHAASAAGIPEALG